MLPAYMQTLFTIFSGFNQCCSKTYIQGQEIDSLGIEEIVGEDDRGMDKEDMVNIYNGILLSHKKEQNNGIIS